MVMQRKYLNVGHLNKELHCQNVDTFVRVCFDFREHLFPAYANYLGTSETRDRREPATNHNEIPLRALNCRHSNQQVDATP